MNLTTLALLKLTMNFIDVNRIPDDFIMGASTSSYQIEGGWNEDGKGANIWDTYTQNYLQDTGNIACDSYHRYLEDVDILKYLNVTHYRFSLSWSRILPNGDISNVNRLGVEYYHKLIDALLVNNIEPMITLYHWDLPQTLQDIGGWLNPDIVDFFGEYARFVYNEYGKKIKYWMTINEPKQICLGGYGNGEFAPGIKSPGIEIYQCGHNVLKAHARAYHIYDDEFRQKQNGKIAFTVDVQWNEPASDLEQDKEAAERSMEFYSGIYANPVFHPNGNYPQIVIDRIDARSKAEGYNVSRLPKFTQTEIDYIKGTSDFFSLNTYFTLKTSWIEDLPIDKSPSIEKDTSAYVFLDPQWETQGNGWGIYPEGIRKVLNWINQHYNHPEIIITENGYCDNDEHLDDDKRIDYHREYIRNILLALYEDNVNVTGYMVWSLMDNLEWQLGYSLKFGLYQVDFNDTSRRRTIKKSGEYFRKLITTRQLDTSGTEISYHHHHHHHKLLFVTILSLLIIL